MTQNKLAIKGGKPIRKNPLPLEFPGVHHMDKKEIKAAVRVLKARSLFRYYGVDLKKEVSKLESEFAQQLGTKYAIGVASGTGALYVALSALGVGPGQEVIVPAYLWVSVLAAIVNLGAIPVLADIDETFCLDPAERRETYHLQNPGHYWPGSNRGSTSSISIRATSFPRPSSCASGSMKKYGIDIDLQRPELSVTDYERLHNGPVYAHDADRCCHDRKIAVLHRVAVNYDAWATGIRRDQGPTRADTPVLKWDKKFGLVKISPLAAWTKKDVWKRILNEQIPYNPLHDQNYPSIGCQPCTRPVQPGEDERAGRWSGSTKTECGLHTGKD